MKSIERAPCSIYLIRLDRDNTSADAWGEIHSGSWVYWVGLLCIAQTKTSLLNYEEYIEHNGSTGFQKYYEEIETNKTNGRSDIPIYYDEDVDALAIEDEASAVVILNLMDIIS